MNLNARITTIAFGTLPVNWDEWVDGRMAYIHEGDNVIVDFSCFLEAEQSFKECEVGRALEAFFAAHPEMESITLQSI